MSITDPIEVSAASVEEAIKDALEQLGAHEEDVVIEVIATPRAGVLGLGARQARVRVRRRAEVAATSGVQSPPPAPAISRTPPVPKPPRASAPSPRNAEPQPPRAPKRVVEPAEEREDALGEGADAAFVSETSEAPRRTADLDQQAREASEILVRILEMMGEKAEVTPGSLDPESLELEIKGDGSGILIGRHGQTLDALEYVVNRIVARRIRDAVPIMLETESYRARRRQQLHRMALSMGERAKREHQSVTLDPMPPRDRRVVHLALKDDPMITTRSSGDGFLRAVEIVPTDNRRDRDREREGRGRRRERERERPDAVGEQGGFKHGQKRIV